MREEREYRVFLKWEKELKWEGYDWNYRGVIWGWSGGYFRNVRKVVYLGRIKERKKERKEIKKERRKKKKV